MSPDNKIQAPKLSEIEQALKEKAISITPSSKNSEISELVQTFEEDYQSIQTPKEPIALKNSENSRMATVVMRLSGGIIKKQKHAEYILLGFAVLAIGVSFYLFFVGNYKSKSRQVSDDLLQQIKQSMSSNR